MVSILTYLLLGLLFYIVIIPIVEELVTVIIQGLEIVKSRMILTITKMQTKTEKSKPKEKLTNAIGFTLQEDDDDYEDE